MADEIDAGNKLTESDLLHKAVKTSEQQKNQEEYKVEKHFRIQEGIMVNVIFRAF